MEGTKRHKFGVSPKEERTSNGIVFDSKRERHRYDELCMLVRSGDIEQLELQPRYDWKTFCEANNRSVERKNFYKADFRYIDTATGATVIEDVKGHRTAEYKRKKRIVETLYQITITEV